jgi:hypothetical protein
MMVAHAGKLLGESGRRPGPQPAEHLPHPLAVQAQHGQNRPKLDDDLKGVGRRGLDDLPAQRAVLVAEMGQSHRVAGQDQMAG